MLKLYSRLPLSMNTSTAYLHTCVYICACTYVQTYVADTCQKHMRMVLIITGQSQPSSVICNYVQPTTDAQHSRSNLHNRGEVRTTRNMVWPVMSKADAIVVLAYFSNLKQCSQCGTVLSVAGQLNDPLTVHGTHMPTITMP